MFESLKQFNNIVVSGPQRSGTRITARVIAEDTEKTYVDERNINFHDIRLLNWYLIQGNAVVQCPGLCHLLHHIDHLSTLVIMVIRPIDEILQSEAENWSNKSRLMELYKYGYSEGVISVIKYEFWNKIQKPALDEKGREVRYHALEKHHLFVQNRKSFRWDQTQ